jgi:Secretion system C-terminal sorting domain
MKKYLILLIILFLGISFIKAQMTQQQMLDLYWHYRWRLVNYFEVVGMGAGESTPAAYRNGEFFPNYMEWVDGPVVDGYYIGVLATEYRLLNENNQDCSETIMELYYALHAIFRLDSLADNKLGSGNPTISFSNFLGFVPGDDVPSDFVSTYSNELNLNISPSSIHWVTGSGKPVYVNSTSAEYPDWLTDGTEYPSCDQYGSLLMGLALAAEYAPNYDVTFTWYDTRGSLCSCTANLQQMAKQLGAGILNYIANYSYNYDLGTTGYILYGPGGTQGPGPITTGGGNAEPYEIPMSNMASNIFNTSIPVNSLNVLGWGALAPEMLQIQYWNTTNSTCNLVYNTYCGDGADNTNEVLSIVYTAIGNSWNSTQFSSARDEIQWLGSDNQCLSVCAAYTNHYGKNIFYQGVLTALYTSNDNLADFDFCGAYEMLSEAPSDGPFTHSYSGYIGDFAPNGWASDRRFIDVPPACDGQVYTMVPPLLTVQPTGNYNGLDYMLMYNLYCLCSQMEFANTINIPTSCTYPYEYPPFPEGCSGLPLPIGTIADKFNITSVNCSPIIVNQLDVTSTGGLVLQGGSTSFIDLNPSSGNTIIVNSNGYFDASCTYNCCDVNPTFYVNEYNNSNLHFDAPIHGNDDTTIDIDNSSSLPSYQKTLEFDTLFLQNGISCYPNPFNTQTTIAFSLIHNSTVSIYLTDMNGVKVTDIINNENYNYGNHQINFAGTKLAAGTYICIFNYANNKKTIKIIKD